MRLLELPPVSGAHNGLGPAQETLMGASAVADAPHDRTAEVAALAHACYCVLGDAVCGSEETARSLLKRLPLFLSHLGHDEGAAPFLRLLLRAGPGIPHCVPEPQAFVQTVFSLLRVRRKRPDLLRLLSALCTSAPSFDGEDVASSGVAADACAATHVRRNQRLVLSSLLQADAAALVLLDVHEHLPKLMLSPYVQKKKKSDSMDAAEAEETAPAGPGAEHADGLESDSGAITRGVPWSDEVGEGGRLFRPSVAHAHAPHGRALVPQPDDLSVQWHGALEHCPGAVFGAPRVSLRELVAPLTVAESSAETAAAAAVLDGARGVLPSALAATPRPGAKQPAGYASELAYLLAQLHLFADLCADKHDDGAFFVRQALPMRIVLAAAADDALPAAVRGGFVRLLSAAHLDGASWEHAPPTSACHLPQAWRVWEGLALHLPGARPHAALGAMRNLVRSQLRRAAGLLLSGSSSGAGGKAEHPARLYGRLAVQAPLLEPLLQLAARMLRTQHYDQAREVESLIPPLLRVLRACARCAVGSSNLSHLEGASRFTAARRVALAGCGVLHAMQLLQQHVVASALLVSMRSGKLKPSPGVRRGFKAEQAHALDRAVAAGVHALPLGGIDDDVLPQVLLPLLAFGDAELTQAVLQALSAQVERRHAAVRDASEIVLLHEAPALEFHAAASVEVAALRDSIGHLGGRGHGQPGGDPEADEIELRQVHALLLQLRARLHADLPPRTAVGDETPSPAAVSRARRLELMRSLRLAEVTVELLEVLRPTAGGGDDDPFCGIVVMDCELRLPSP